MLAQPASRLIFNTIPWYSFLIVCGMILAIFQAIREEKKQGLPKDTVMDLVLWMLPTAILGARLYYVIFSWSSYASDPISILYIWEGGLAIYGGIFTGLLVVFIFSKKRKISMLTICDLIVPGLALAQGIGRWGNYFNMEAYGLEITDPAWMFFPAGVLINEGGANVWHMATFFYESMLDLLIAIVLFIFRARSKNRQKGDVFLGYVVMYGAARILTEHFRTDSLISLSGSFRVSQILSVLMCIIVVVILLVRILKTTSLGSVNKDKNFVRWIAAVIGLTAILITYPYGFKNEPFMGYNLSLTVVVALSFFSMVSLRVGEMTVKNRVLTGCTLLFAMFVYILNLKLTREGTTSIPVVLLRLFSFGFLAVLTAVSQYIACVRGEDHALRKA